MANKFFLIKHYCNYFTGATMIEVEPCKSFEDAERAAKMHFKKTHHKKNGAPIGCLFKCVDTCNLKMEIQELTNLSNEIPNLIK